MKARFLLRAAAVAVGAIVVATLLPGAPAYSHGSTIDPMSRNYGCWKRWGSDFQNPAMATQDPMCWQAWQDNPNAMWNWNGLYKEQVNNNHQAAVPDGQLCSGGLAEGGRYRSMDTVGDWKATNISNSFTLKYHDQAKHGATYVLVYVSKQGYNPLTTPLKWSDLELVTQTGAIAPGAGTTETDPVLNGVTVSIAVNAPGRTGRHIVFTVWRAAHADQNYYWCSDVNFGGTTTPPVTTRPPTTTTPAVTTRPPTTTTPPVTTRPPTTTTPAVTTRPPTTTTPPAGSKTCSATYAVTTSWSGGFQAEIKVTAGSSPISGWKVNWTFANGQTVSQIWNAVQTSTGASISASNMTYNGSLGAAASTTFGFLGTHNGTNTVPALTCVAS